MAADELSDSYVLDLLKKEAADKSLRYSALGLTAFQPQKRSSGAPKPNTRFLRNIVRDVDQHNTALLAKEAQESRERLRRLKDKSSAIDKGDGREPHNSRERERKRVKYDEDRDNRPRRRSIERFTSKRGESDNVRGEATERNKDGERRRGKDTHRRQEKSERSTERRHRQRRSKSSSPESPRSRSRSRSRRDRKEKSSHRSHRRRRSRSRSKSRTRSPSLDGASSRTHRPSGKKSSRHRSYSSDSHEEQISPNKAKTTRIPDRKLVQRSDDTNNLTSQLSSALRQKRQAISSRTKRSLSPSALSNKSESSDDIGPFLPLSTSSASTSRPMHTASTAPRVRGRGAINGESAMTARFNPSYDPTIDVQPEEDADDWDMALEAMRDRQRWKQQGAERLRSAGFDDTFIEAWETNTTKDESKIKWAKDSSAREWDRGKVVDDETGEVNLKAAWA